MGYEITVKPRLERIEIIEKRVLNSEEFGEPIFNFRGDSYTPKVISLPINFPIYRMENCRTFSAQQTEIANNELESDYFQKNQELASAQQLQHYILLTLAKEGNTAVTPIIKVLSDDGQRYPILITSSGVVVNGNRRLSAMRELYRGKDGSIDDRFSHVKCTVLPSDTTLDEIDDIEADLQAQKQTKLEYDWIGDAKLVRRQVNKGRSIKEVADRLKRSKSEIQNVLDAFDEADLYLSEWVKKPGHYELVSDEGKQIFGDIPKNIAIMNTNLQNASRAIAWSLFENRNRISGRVYGLNAAFGKLAPQVLEMMSEQLDLDIQDNETDDIDDDFSIDIGSEESGADYSHIIKALSDPDIKDDAFSSLLEACETAIELDKGQKNERAALNALSQVNSKLVAVDINSAGVETLAAMLKQLESIKKALDKIEEGIQKRQAQ